MLSVRSVLCALRRRHNRRVPNSLAPGRVDRRRNPTFLIQYGKWLVCGMESAGLRWGGLEIEYGTRLGKVSYRLQLLWMTLTKLVRRTQAGFQRTCRTDINWIIFRFYEEVGKLKSKELLVIQIYCNLFKVCSQLILVTTILFARGIDFLVSLRVALRKDPEPTGNRFHHRISAMWVLFGICNDFLKYILLWRPILCWLPLPNAATIHRPKSNTSANISSRLYPVGLNKYRPGGGWDLAGCSAADILSWPDSGGKHCM